MPETLPVYRHGQTLSAKASAPITGGQLIAVTGYTNLGTQVAPTSGATSKVLGVAAFDVAANDTVTVHCGGVQSLTAASSVPAGSSVMAAAGGQVAVWNGTVPTEYLGLALTTAGAGAKVRVAMSH